MTRGADAGTALALLWFLPIEEFSQLAMAQAWVAPLLLIFLSPETVLYRDYSSWRLAGPSFISGRLKAFRTFALFKAAVALALAGFLAFFFPFGETYLSRLCSLSWGFTLALAPQVSGPDREFLRLDLKLKAVNVITLSQKLVLFMGVMGAVRFSAHKIETLAGVALVSSLVSAWLARRMVRGSLGSISVPPTVQFKDLVLIVGQSLRQFSIWNHLSGVILNWVQTLDLLVLGFLKLPVRELGLYAVILKIANLSFALPLALSNLFVIWIGRRLKSDENQAVERRQLLSLSFKLMAVSLGVSLGLWSISPYLLTFMARGRWDLAEQAMMLEWLIWILCGGVVLSSSLLLSGWLAMRLQISELFCRVYLPWGVVSLFVYSVSAALWGSMGAAMANSAVYVIFLGLLLYFKKSGSPGVS